MLEPQDGAGEVGDGVLKLGREKAVVCGWKGKRTLCVHQAPTGARTGQGSVGLGQDQCIYVEGCEKVLLAGEAGRGWGHRHHRSCSTTGAWSPLSAFL